MEGRRGLTEGPVPCGRARGEEGLPDALPGSRGSLSPACLTHAAREADSGFSQPQGSQEEAPQATTCGAKARVKKLGAPPHQLVETPHQTSSLPSPTSVQGRPGLCAASRDSAPALQGTRSRASRAGAQWVLLDTGQLALQASHSSRRTAIASVHSPSREPLGRTKDPTPVLCSPHSA